MDIEAKRLRKNEYQRSVRNTPEGKLKRVAENKIQRNIDRFGGNREKALERDKYTCKYCGKTHHDTILDVHHLDEKGRYSKSKNHSMDNLITLCHSCHGRLHGFNNKKKD